MAVHDPPGRTEIEGVTRLLSGAAGEPQRLIALHRVRASTFNAASLDERRRAVPVRGQQRSSARDPTAGDLLLQVAAPTRAQLRARVLGSEPTVRRASQY